jgi:catechol 2,3-dioxygenase-like lactoylglutathione lyase family enzyme
VLATEEPEVTVWRVDPGDVRTDMHQLAFPGEDITDRPLPAEVAPGLMRLLATRPPSGRHRLAGSPSAAPVKLWLTLEVDRFAPTAAFYRDVLGLPEIDGWSIDDEAGAVFAVGDARIEVEHPVTTPKPGARVAIEFPDLDALTAGHKRVSEHAEPTPVLRHHRGHSGFTVLDPDGTEIYVWSEQ